MMVLQVCGRLFRKLGFFRGKHRIVRALLGKRMKGFRNQVVPGKHQCQYLLPNIIENVGFDIFADGIFEEDSIRLIISSLPEKAGWLDIGANIGSICIPVCRLRPDVSAIAIEASPRVFGYLEKNVSMNHLENLRLVNKALSDSGGEQVSFFSPEEKFGKGSMSSVFTSKAEMTETITLDELVDQFNIKPSFIKIDVEGYECQVFRGGKKLLSNPGAPAILFEFIDWAEKAGNNNRPGDAQKLLLEYGYQLNRFDKGRLEPMNDVMTSGSALILAKKHG